MNYRMRKTKTGFSFRKVKTVAVKHPAHKKVQMKPVAKKQGKNMGTLLFVKLPETMGSAVGDVAIGEFIQTKR